MCGLQKAVLRASSKLEQMRTKWKLFSILSLCFALILLLLHLINLPSCSVPCLRLVSLILEHPLTHVVPREGSVAANCS